MKIKEVIALLEKEGTWVKWNRKTRDHVLFGDDNQEIKRIGVCWVATMQVIEEAMKEDIHFIITHENPFYTTGTALESSLFDSIIRKQKLLSKANICVYRSHDVWDSIQSYGVSDMWAKRLGFSFEPRVIDSYYQYANIPVMSGKQLAKHVANRIKQDGEEGVYLFGNENKKIKRIAIGTGAGTNLFDMLEYNPDAVIVSDDGITNYTEVQYAIDNHIVMIVVNHAGCEICGIKEMVNFFHDKCLKLDVKYLKEGYDIKYYLGE